MKKINLIDKIEILHSKKDQKNISCYIFFSCVPEKGVFKKINLENYRVKLPNDYINIIENYGPVSFEWLDFLSFADKESANFEEYINFLKEWNYSEGYFPFAKDAPGNIFCFCEHNKAIWMFDIEDFLSPSQKIADSFEEFVSECVLGKRYPEFSYTENNPFYDFIKEQGWA